MTLEIGSKMFRQMLDGSIVEYYALTLDIIANKAKTDLQKDLVDLFYDDVIEHCAERYPDPYTYARKLIIVFHPRSAHYSYLTFSIVDYDTTDLINIYHIERDREAVIAFETLLNDLTTVCSQEEISVKKCTCGAKYTSTPNYHLEWCDLRK